MSQQQNIGTDKPDSIHAMDEARNDRVVGLLRLFAFVGLFVLIGLSIWQSPTANAQTQGLDWGDLPAPYNTLTADGGPSHVATGPFLGDERDTEADGQPTTIADGDDTNGDDDEDGVQVLINSRFDEFQLSFEAFNSDFGDWTVACWVDLDGNGVFDNDDSTERRSSTYSDQSFLIRDAFAYPLDALDNGPVYIRCRVANDTDWQAAGGISPDGPLDSGEVEDYLYQLQIIYDYGDLPGNLYPTTDSLDGPKHNIENGAKVWFGAEPPDPENEALTSPNADGDDNARNDDEDGVDFPSSLTQGNSVNIPVTVNTDDGNDDEACVNAWADFGNGLEPLAYTAINGFPTVGTISDTILIEGTTTFTVDIPYGSPFPAAFRFRITDECNQGGGLITGIAENGEVEDYRVPYTGLDWGDLPSPDYPTSANNNGPNHIISGDAHLGSASDSPDADVNGQPDSNALGDDTDGNDDENGVLFPLLIPGFTQEMEVTVTDPDDAACVNAWIDWDGSGLVPLAYTTLNGTGPGATISNLTLPSGTSIIEIDVPSDVTGPPAVRFRLTDECGQGGGAITGQATNGEVEDYRPEIAGLDWGDLPAPYKTLSSAGGPSHAILGPTLGLSSPDAETDGQPTANADGDDNNNIDDEEGVTVQLLQDQILGDRLRLSYVPVNATIQNIIVACWVDINRDGQFDNSNVNNNERQTRTFSTVNDTPTLETFEFDYPLDLFTNGPVYIRCRVAYDDDWTAAGGVAPNGVVASGEVEDHFTNLQIVYDFGDLPPGDYPVRLDDNGARHLVEGGAKAWFGTVAPDVELDGFLFSNGDADDNNNVDDEDGLVIPATLNPGRSIDILMTTSADDNDVCVNGFVDFDGTGLVPLVFTDDGSGSSGTMSNLTLAAGTTTFTVDVPISATGRAAFRFRITDECGQGGGSVSGEAQNGEVEDYLSQSNSLDWGDLPDGPYPTLASNNGPSHLLVSDEVYLGSASAFRPDGEANGQPTSNARGDDNNGSDDENGLSIVSDFVPGFGGEFSLDVTDPDGSACLNAWVDWDGSGLAPLTYTAIDGSGPAGTISNLVLSSGTFLFSVDVPTGVTGGAALRFRLTDECNQGGGTPTGPAENGEVEDHITSYVEFDWGDLPGPYNTLATDGGPSHGAIDPSLGSPGDGEPDGQPTTNADGDDNDGNDDEDGVTVQVLGNSNLLRLLTKPVNTSNGSATMACWVDANGDGIFDNSDATERRTRQFDFVNGLTFELDYPLDRFTTSTINVRCRIAKTVDWELAGGVAPDGPVRTGEVEDHLFNVDLPRGTINIIKQTAPAGGTGFGFTDDIESPNSFILDDGQTKTFADLTPGQYTVTEDDPGVGAFLSGLVCDDASSAIPSTVDLGARKATINLEPGETVTCTFTNTEEDLIIIGKLTEPAGGTGFDFTSSLGDFSLDDGEIEFFDVQGPGTFTFTELEPGPDYVLSSLECAILKPEQDPVFVAGNLVDRSVDVTLDGPGQAAFCLFVNSLSNACPVDPNVGNELTDLIGVGMGSPTRQKMMAKITVPNAGDVVELYGQMAAKEYTAVRYVRFIFGDRSYIQVQPETDLGEKAAITWWGEDLTAEFQAQAKPFVKGRWFLNKGMRKMKVPRAYVLYPTYQTSDEYANAWSTFTSPDNFVAGTPGFDQVNTNILPIPELQVATDVTVELAVTDVNRDPRTIDVTVSAGGVSETVTLTGPTTRRSELLNILTVTLENVPAGTDEVEILMESVLGSGDSAALLGAAANYACEVELAP